MTNILSMFERSMKFKQGEVVIREGEKNRDLYILLSGTLEVSVRDKSSDIVVSEIKTPEILGEISFLNGTPRTATVTAKTEAEIYVLDYAKVKEELSDIPIWFKLILQTFTNRMKVCGDKIKEYDQKLNKQEEELSKYKKN